MDKTPPGVIRNPGHYFDQALDQPVHGVLNLFAPDIELRDHMQDVVSQNPSRYSERPFLREGKPEPVVQGLRPACYCT
jgi:hypothetical protein